jgi:D-alanyl-lipoteichoic acid acyltransferase DltB (MBOAT superfamily)
LQFLRDFFAFDEQKPMIFTTSGFWLFFGFVLLVYQFIYQRKMARNLFLLGCSIFFYYKSGGFFVLLLLLTTLVDYNLGWLVYRARNQWQKKILIVLSLVVNLGMLSYFKYSYFFADLLQSIAGIQIQPVNYLAVWQNALTGSRFDIAQIILPVGISFYTFQSISYVIDIYRGEIKPVNNLWDFAFFVSFFPQLVAGPIVRATDFVPQIDQPYRLSPVEFNHALYLIVNGLVKKILISDYISVNFVDRVFESPVSYTGFENLMAVYGYAIQIYCDFSGYTDIAIGVALLLGFRLTLNFDSPYVSANITEFWRRWHISLSTWLRDYLYISLGGNRKGRFRTYLNLLVTMLLGGLWHGAHIKFILWGGLHGAGLALHKMWMEWTGTRGRQSKGLGRLAGQVFTFHFVAFCWIFFRAGNMEIAGQVLSQIGTKFQFELIPPMLDAYAFIFGLMFLAYVIHWLPRGLKEQVKGSFYYVPDLAKAALAVIVILGLYQVKTAAVQPFIYFQF